MKNNREARIDSANQTLQIIEDKKYRLQDKIIDITEEIDYSVGNSKLYTPEILDDLLVQVGHDVEKEEIETILVIENCTSMQAAEKYLSKGKIGCLNFASAKNAGGGFLSGAQAQEESLSRASALYPALKKYQEEVYDYNRNRNTFLYSDRMIYSPAVIFFKDDNNNLLENPYCMDIVTSPAVNIGAMVQNRRDDERSLVEDTMLTRIDKILALFYTNKVKTLILGAWGCGVFRNDPEDVARYFAHFLINDGKYSKCFDNIIFAVYDTGKNKENISAFEKVLKDN